MSANSNIFEIRLRNNGRLFSRHYEARTPEQAALRATGKGKILFVRKVHPTDIIGSIKSMNLSGIIGVGRRQPDVILDERTLDSIIFPNSKRGKNRNRRFKDERRYKGEGQG